MAIPWMSRPGDDIVEPTVCCADAGAAAVAPPRVTRGDCIAEPTVCCAACGAAERAEAAPEAALSSPEDEGITSPRDC